MDFANRGFVALGARAYKNSPSLANNGVDTFYAQSGIYPGDPTKNYANWSFDFVYNTGTCTGSQVFLEIDTDPTAGVTYTTPANLTAARAVKQKRRFAPASAGRRESP